MDRLYDCCHQSPTRKTNRLASELGTPPVGQFARSCRLQQVVVAAKALLAIAGYKDIEASIGPQNIVRQFHTLSSSLYPYRISPFLKHRIVQDARVIVPTRSCIIDHDALIAIGVDQIVLDPTTEKLKNVSPWMPTEFE